MIRSGIAENKIFTLTNSVLLPKYTKNEFYRNRITIRKEFNIQKNDFVIGYTGRLSEEKGLIFLLNAGKQLIERRIAIKILLIGDGYQRSYLESEAKQLGIGKHVLFAGFQKEVSKFIPSFDVFVLPSLTEGTPMALLEAMSFGLPVIATAVGGVPKVISHGNNGLLISDSSSSEITDSINKLLEDTPLRTRISEGAKTLIKEKYNLKRQIKKVEGLYCGLLCSKY